jgi:hypothetical protein
VCTLACQCVPCQRDLAKAVRQDRIDNPHLYTAAATAAAAAASSGSGVQRASSKSKSAAARPAAAAAAAAPAAPAAPAQKGKARKESSNSSSSDDGESDAGSSSAKGGRKRARNSSSDKEKKHGRRRGGPGEPLDTTGWLDQTLPYCLRCDNSDDPQLECAGCPRSYHNSAFCHTAASAAVAAGGTAATNSPNWLCRFCCKGRDGSLEAGVFTVSAPLSIAKLMFKLCVLVAV